MFTKQIFHWQLFFCFGINIGVAIMKEEFERGIELDDPSSIWKILMIYLFSLQVEMISDSVQGHTADM